MIRDFKYGNSKVGEDTLIINMGSATKCPSAARGLCNIAGKCYAVRDEKIYSDVVRNYRDRQEDYWLRTPAAQMTFDIEEVFLANSSRSSG